MTRFDKNLPPLPEGWSRNTGAVNHEPPFSPAVYPVFLLASILLFPLAFPPFGWWPLMLPAMALLLLVVVEVRPAAALTCGILHGTIAFGIALFWMFRLFSVFAILLYLLMGLFTGLFCLLFNLSARKSDAIWWKMLMAAIFWTAVEFYRSEYFVLRFPWITVGSSIGPTYLSSFIGVYGVSFAMVLAVAGVMARRTWPVALFLSLAMLALGVFRPPRIEPDPETSIVVTVVQDESSLLENYLELTRRSDAAGSDLIIWPEYALPYDVRQRPFELASLQQLCAEMDALLLVGTQTRTGKAPSAWRNTALLINQEGVVGEYYKNRPVHFFTDGIAGEKAEPISSALGLVGTPICFDCDYTEITRQLADGGAEFFAIPSYDKKTWTVAQHRQHSLLFRHRAAETRRWIAIAASSGFSQFIDPNGNVHAALPVMDPGTLTGRISPRTETTVFVRFGWLFPLFISGLALLLVVGLILQRLFFHQDE